jgi:hypothetical protein
MNGHEIVLCITALIGGLFVLGTMMEYRRARAERKCAEETRERANTWASQAITNRHRAIQERAANRCSACKARKRKESTNAK